MLRADARSGQRVNLMMQYQPLATRSQIEQDEKWRRLADAVRKHMLSEALQEIAPSDCVVLPLAATRER